MAAAFRLQAKFHVRWAACGLLKAPVHQRFLLPIRSLASLSTKDALCETCETPKPASVGVHRAHIFLATGKTNWSKDIADESELVKSAVKAFNEASTKDCRIAITATDDDLGISAHSEQSKTVLIFPARLALTLQALDFKEVGAVLVEHYREQGDATKSPAYQPYTNAKQWRSDQLELLSKLVNVRGPDSQLTVTPLSPSVRHLFVCTHAERDSRCGRAAATIFPKLRELAKGFNEQAGEVKVLVHATSHIGGHKYAGNVIDYGEGDWYGGVHEGNCDEFFSLVMAGKVATPLWRGRVGLAESAQEVLYKQLQSSESEAIHLPPQRQEDIVVHVKDANGVHELRGLVNERLMTVLKRSNLAIEGACGGNMECGTCHVVLDEDWQEQLPPGSEAEQDMIDMFDHSKDGSRLSCQILLKPALNGLKLSLPSVS